MLALALRVGFMQQTTTRQLYAYWDRVRNGRVTPRRFEIEPAKIANLLPETLIAECEDGREENVCSIFVLNYLKF